MTTRRGIVAPTAWLAGLSGLGWWLLRAGEAGVAPPPLAGPGAWADWAETVGPVPAVFAVLRLGCVAAVAYLLVALLVGFTARATGSGGLARLSDAISIGLVRRIVNGTVGLGVTTGVLAAGATPLASAAAGAVPAGFRHHHNVAVPAGGLGDGVQRPDLPVMGVADATPDNPAPAPRMRVADAAAIHGAGPLMRPLEGVAALGAAPVMRALEGVALSNPPPTMRPAAEEPTAPSPPPAMRPAAEEPTAPTPPPTMRAADRPAPVPLEAPTMRPDGPALPSSVVLQPGDHLWAVAERHLGQHLGHRPYEAEITAYWQRLIELNRHELADPANPDLVFSGQLIGLPVI